MNLLSRAAVKRLRDEGCLVVLPDEPQPLPIYDLASAIGFVRTAGHTVIKVKPPVLPRIGQCWAPTRGKGRNGKPPKLERRYVCWATSSEVAYALTQDGAQIRINAASWAKWVRASRAVRV